VTRPMKTKSVRSRQSATVVVDSITPFLWFNDQAEPAARFYVSVFRGSKISEVSRSGKSPNSPAVFVEFELAGQKLMALNGGPHFKLTPSFSLFVSCATQQEVDSLWRRLLRGGKESQCGWLVDRFGLSWQIIPRKLPELLSDPDPEKAGRVMAAMLKMKKIVVRDLEKAYSSR